MNNNKKNWNLYVLRYNYSGNYYVGTTPDLVNRMLIHWKRTSTKNNLPKWSKENKSINGFKYYWFKINNENVDQGEAEHCENDLADLLVEEIKKLNKEVRVGNGKFVDTEEIKWVEIEIKGIENKFNEIDEKINSYLKQLKLLEYKKTSIKCFEIGSVGEYDHSLCNEKWSDVALIEFSSDNKETVKAGNCTKPE